MKYWLFYIVFITLVFGCGSRKVDTDISKQASEVRQSEQNKSEEKSTSQIKSTKSEENKNDITDRETTKTTTTEYGPDGKPIKTTTTETQKKRTDKSANNKKEEKEITTTHWKRMEIYKTITKKKVIKQKSKQSERTDPFIWLFFILLGLNVVYFGWKRFKP